MGRSFRAGHEMELEDSVADPFNKNQSFGGLKLYVKELDANTLPPFLARLCDPDKPCRYTEEEVLCVFETAAEVHGCNIVQHISRIVSTIIRIMSSATGSLHSVGCSKVICAISRYGLDPLGTEQEKSGIISSLCSPLSGWLMSSNECVSSGSALCVTALIQSNNWQFASHELINDICLKVSGALEEVHCQTISHLGLVVALLKQNWLTLEPYGRSLIRSGLSILDESTKESNSQMVISSIQMIHSIMKNLDLSIISSEISSIIQAMERLQDDSIPEISTPAFQAAETAKKLCRQEDCGYGRRISPLAKYGGRHSRKGSYSHSVMDDAEIRDSDSNESLSDDVQSVHRFRDHDSQPSLGQHSVVPGSARARRRLWSNGSDKSHQISSDDFSHTIIPDHHDISGVIPQSNSAGLLKSLRRSLDVPTRIADPCPTCLTPQTTNRFSQISRRGSFSEDYRMQSTPRKQLQFYNSCSNSKRDTHRLPDSPAFRQVRRCSGQCTDGEVAERNGYWDSIQHDNQCYVQNDDTLIEDLKLPTNGERIDNAGESPSAECQAEKEKMTRGKKGSTNCARALLLLFICVVAMVALLLAWWKEGQRELYVVPT
ncbi:protein SINE1-like [Lolium rigidum]|uniref:protein SINE1-like n=1 Tax=Lolium rigidum TaxID=89674 RepID=UPI001F5CF130|nr:protein SINE1-like [Lolium rigidum]